MAFIVITHTHSSMCAHTHAQQCAHACANVHTHTSGVYARTGMHAHTDMYDCSCRFACTYTLLSPSLFSHYFSPSVNALMYLYISEPFLQISSAPLSDIAILQWLI